VCVCVCVCTDRRNEYTHSIKTWPHMECNVIWICVNPVHDEVLDCGYFVKVSCRPYHKSGFYTTDYLMLSEEYRLFCHAC